MKPVCLTLLFFATSILSCQQKSRVNPTTATPKALDEGLYSSLSTPKRGYGDLVEELYQERVEGSKELQQLEAAIESLQRAEADSTKDFLNFNSKNLSYYGTAERHAMTLNDSNLKAQLMAIIQASRIKYDSSIAVQRSLMDLIQAKKIRLGDIHTIVMISQTIPMIEAYQRANRPEQRPLRAHLSELEKVLRQTEQQAGR